MINNNLGIWGSAMMLVCLALLNVDAAAESSKLLQNISEDRSAVCKRSDELNDALAIADSTIEEANLLLACADGIAIRMPSRYCVVSDPDTELGFMAEELKSTVALLLPAVQAARETARIDPFPKFMLQQLNGTFDKVNDFSAVGGGDLEGIERCNGGRLSYDCLTLVHACGGDFKCYGDGTCACYTCTNQGIPGGCGIQP